MHIGGRHPFPSGALKMTPALHGSGFPGDEGMVYTGNPCGFLIFMEGKTICHAGDTGLSMEMKLMGDMNHIDAALLPVGDNYTMGADDALEAARLLKTDLVIPMHFGTFPVLAPDSQAFCEAAEAAGIGFQSLGYGESLDL